MTLTGGAQTPPNERITMAEWKAKLAELKPSLKDKTKERRRLVGKEVTLQKRLVTTRVSPTVIRRRYQEIN